MPMNGGPHVGAAPDPIRGLVLKSGGRYQGIEPQFYIHPHQPGQRHDEVELTDDGLQGRNIAVAQVGNRHQAEIAKRQEKVTRPGQFGIEGGLIDQLQERINSGRSAEVTQTGISF